MKTFHNGKVQLHAGDCMEVLRSMPDNSIDAVVTDPPYHLTSIVKRFGSSNAAPAKGNEAFIRASKGFMGKIWDGGDIAFRPELWAEVLRVLKPGGHMVAFGGDRTFHRLACAIEDGGFQIRHSLAWLFGSGFPKNHAVNRNPMFCQCGAAERNGGSTNHAPSQLAHNGKQAAFADGALLSEGAHHSIGKEPDCSAYYPQDYDSHDERPRLVPSDGQAFPPSPQYAQGHIHFSVPDDEQHRGPSHNPSPAQCTSRLSSQDYSRLENCGNEPLGNILGNRLSSDTSESQSHIPDSCQGSSFPKHGSGFPVCQVCGKPNADGFGTSLKPAMELICLARKPLSESTVAANVLRWGTGALNIDATRIGTETVRIYNHTGCSFSQAYKEAGTKPGFGGIKTVEGRWPANLCHDGSPEVMEGFPESNGQQGNVRGTEPSRTGNENTVCYGEYGRTPFEKRTDSGSAARFFYTAKADAGDRLGSKHPTVKPVDLMQWLVRLVCPKGGTVLDPFAGTGTTGAASFIEGCRCVLIEREAEYLADIERRMELLLSGPDERARKLAKSEPHESLPLFGAL